MSETLTLPVLPLADEVVLPGMVVPIELSDQDVRGAIEAARNKGLGRGPGIRSEDKPQVLLVPRLGERGAWQVIDMFEQLDDPSAIADRAGYASYLTAEQKLTLLETADLVKRLELAIGWTRDHLAELDVAETIRKDVTEGMEKQQK